MIENWTKLHSGLVTASLSDNPCIGLDRETQTGPALEPVWEIGQMFFKSFFKLSGTPWVDIIEFTLKTYRFKFQKFRLYILEKTILYINTNKWLFKVLYVLFSHKFSCYRFERIKMAGTAFMLYFVFFTMRYSYWYRLFYQIARRALYCGACCI